MKLERPHIVEHYEYISIVILSIISLTCFRMFPDIVNLNVFVIHVEGNFSAQSSFLPLPPGTAFLQGSHMEDLLPPYQWTSTVFSSSDRTIPICGHSPAYWGTIHQSHHPHHTWYRLWGVVFSSYQWPPFFKRRIKH